MGEDVKDIERTARALVEKIKAVGDTFAAATIKQSHEMVELCAALGVEGPRIRTCECCRGAS